MKDLRIGVRLAIGFGSDALGNAAGQVSATAQSLSQSSSEQAASVEETTASIEQMTASITQNTENAKVTDNMATKSPAEAEQGGKAVKETVEAMKSIAGKIGIIDDIAYQTNLLASMPPSKPPVPASTARALPWWPPKCASWPNAARSRRRKSASWPAPA
jgi:hypothetical protein